jgi:hypothetical protein
MKWKPKQVVYSQIGYGMVYTYFGNCQMFIHEIYFEQT